MKNIIVYIYLILSLVSCAAKHNIPQSQKANKIEQPNKGFAFVDQNGNFYPNNWKKEYGNPPKNAKRTAFSLMKNATEKDKIESLKKSELAYLAELQKLVKSKNRIFILIHGFNAEEVDATKSYTLIEKKLKLNSKKDAIIQFYWDGLVSSSLFGGAKIWFDAANNSQLAGEFGLRRILNAIRGKEVYLISHSRGASVILSSLTTSEISDNLVEETKEIHNVDIYEDSKNLLENRNKIYAIMLAPAIGVSDFQLNLPDSDEVVYRKFSPQLKVLHITINDTDKMLGKFVGFLAKSLKPTDLGYTSDSFLELSNQYKIIKKTDFSGMKSHKFNDYINNFKFIDIISIYNLN